MIKVMFVCHGNICRSPMAEFLLNDLAKKENLDIFAASSGTSDEEYGNPVHSGTKKILSRLNINCDKKRAATLIAEDYDIYDYFIGMDENNIRNMNLILPANDKTFLLMSFAGENRSVKDPWYTGNFYETYDDILSGIKGFVSYLKK